MKPILGFGPLLLLVALAVVGPALAPWAPSATSVIHRLEAPSVLHWFGTDSLGRDVFSRVLAATRTDVEAAFLAVSISAAIGAPIGAACGYLGGALDRWLGRVVDVLMAFPLFVAAMALVAALGNSLGNVVWATAIVNLPFYIRIARSQIAAKRSLPYVMAARLGGLGEFGIIMRVLLPNILPTLAVQISVNCSWAVLNTAALSFIGLGVRPPNPEWGVLVSEGAQYLTTGQWWVALLPAAALAAAVFSFSLAGDCAHDLLDSRRRG